jgi:hypothetical protein
MMTAGVNALPNMVKAGALQKAATFAVSPAACRNLWALFVWRGYDAKLFLR